MQCAQKYSRLHADSSQYSFFVSKRKSYGHIFNVFPDTQGDSTNFSWALASENFNFIVEINMLEKTEHNFLSNLFTSPDMTLTEYDCVLRLPR